MDAAYQCGMIQFAEKIRKQVTKDINQQLNYYQSIGDHYMTMDELISNLNLVTKNMESEFNNQQISFIQDMITCLRLQNTIEEIEKSRTDNRKP
jgi:hypothetical protein